MSREAFGDPPEHQEVPECCPACGSDFYMPGCTHCEEMKLRVAAEVEVTALRGQLGAASGWIVKALKVLDTVDSDDTDEAARLAALVNAGEVLALTTLARSKPPNAEASGCLRTPMPEDAPRTAAGSPLDRPVGPVAGA